jgi:hypothetical protein
VSCFASTTSGYCIPLFTVYAASAPVRRAPGPHWISNRQHIEAAQWIFYVARLVGGAIERGVLVAIRVVDDCEHDSLVDLAALQSMEFNLVCYTAAAASLAMTMILMTMR